MNRSYTTHRSNTEQRGPAAQAPVPVRRPGQARPRWVYLWQSLRHALTWQELSRRLQPKRLWLFVRNNWFAPTVCALIFVLLWKWLFSAPNSPSADLSSASEMYRPFHAGFVESEQHPSAKTTPAATVKTASNKKLDLPAVLPAAKSVPKSKSAGEGSNSAIDQHLRRFAKVAQDEQKKYGIPASITLGLSLLCSDFGTAHNALAYNNFFGIACNQNLFYNEAELISQNGTCRVKYPSAWAGFRAHSLLLTSGKYKELARTAKSDYKTWASGLEKMGYDQTGFSAEALIKLIEGYKLNRYD